MTLPATSSHIFCGESARSIEQTYRRQRSICSFADHNDGDAPREASRRDRGRSAEKARQRSWFLYARIHKRQRGLRVGSGESVSDSTRRSSATRHCHPLILLRTVTGRQRLGKRQDLQGRPHPGDLRAGRSRGSRGRHCCLHEDIQPAATEAGQVQVRQAMTGKFNASFSGNENRTTPSENLHF